MLWHKKQTSPAREPGLDAGQRYRLLHNRRVMVMATMALLVVGISASVGGYAYVQLQHAISRWQESEAQRQEAEQARIAEQEQRQAAEAQRTEARRDLYFSSILQARAQYYNPEVQLIFIHYVLVVACPLLLESLLASSSLLRFVRP